MASSFGPTASWSNLELRATLLRRAREFFFERGFLEVETPLLSADVVIDRHLDPIEVILPEDPRQPTAGRRMWLQTSPEFAMKRLLAAGGKAIYQVTRAFRAAEIGPLHNPEFTMLEWYRVGDAMHEGMELLADLAESLLQRGPTERISYAEAFQRRLNIDPHTAPIDELRGAAAADHISAPAGLDDDRDGWLDLLLVEAIQPDLGRGRPAILYDYPATQAALARVRGAEVWRRESGVGSYAVAERFELYVDGIELANGYHELLDPAVLRIRNREGNSARARDGKRPLPEESLLLAAMDAGLPASSGVALGFDRLVMIAAGAKSIAEVLAFPVDRA